jgi:hypothetical protein
MLLVASLLHYWSKLYREATIISIDNKIIVVIPIGFANPLIVSYENTPVNIYRVIAHRILPSNSLSPDDIAVPIDLNNNIAFRITPNIRNVKGHDIIIRAIRDGARLHRHSVDALGSLYSYLV